MIRYIENNEIKKTTLQSEVNSKKQVFSSKNLLKSQIFLRTISN